MGYLREAWHQQNDHPHPRNDGWWGPHKYLILAQPLDRSSPYLAWIPALAAHDDPLLLKLNFEDHPLIPVIDSDVSKLTLK
jgi:hypothetical protein